MTGFAIATRTRWIDRHPLPDGHPGDARARLDDLTGELVPEHEWTAGHERAAMARGKVMHVGAADSHAANLDEHLAGRRNRIGSLFRVEVSFSVQHVCDHVVTGEILPEPAFNFKFFSCGCTSGL